MSSGDLAVSLAVDSLVASICLFGLCSVLTLVCGERVCIRG